MQYTIVIPGAGARGRAIRPGLRTRAISRGWVKRQSKYSTSNVVQKTVRDAPPPPIRSFDVSLMEERASASQRGSATPATALPTATATSFCNPSLEEWWVTIFAPRSE